MDPISEIRRLYLSATRATVQRDLTRAIALLKTLDTEEERERAAVYMDGLSQMRSEWGVRPEDPAGGTEGGRGPHEAGHGSGGRRRARPSGGR